MNERNRIARELHDSLLQGFQGLMFRLQAVRDLLPGEPDGARRSTMSRLIEPTRPSSKAAMPCTTFVRRH